MKIVLKIKHLIGIHDFKYAPLIGVFGKETDYKYKYTQKCWLCEKIRTL